MFDLGVWSIGFWLMVVIDIVAVAVLALAIIYGSSMWRKRPQDPDAATGSFTIPTSRLTGARCGTVKAPEHLSQA